MAQECGACTTQEVVAGCIDCYSDDCNAVKAVEDMKCNEYEWKTDKWVKKMEVVDGTDTEIMETCKKYQGEDDICRW